MQTGKKNHFKNENKNQVLEKFVAASGFDMTIYENLISYPIKDAKAGYDFQGGLIHPKTLQLVEEAVHQRHDKTSQIIPDTGLTSLDIPKLRKVEGTFLFGGIIFNNFGHFLLESIVRLWAYEHVREFDPYIFFYSPWGIPEYKERHNYMHQVLKGFNIPFNRIVFISDIVLLSKVIIPQQKYGFGLCRTPDNMIMNFIKSFKIPNPSFKITNPLDKSGSPANKIYVSRSQLPFSQGRPFGEIQFENFLKANGYLIFYPEKHTLYDQLRIYKKAKKIIFCDGGAIYASILLPDLNAKTAIIARRRDHRWNYKELTEHFLGFNLPVLWIDEIVGQFQYGMETWDAAGEINWYNVSVILKNENFVESTFQGLDSPDYEEMKRKELQQYIQSIQTNPRFLNYMQKLREQYPVLPASF